MSILCFAVLVVWLVALTLLVRDLRRRPLSRDVRVIGSHARLVRPRKSTPHREMNGRRDRRDRRDRRAA